jgi:hypothetical protein
VEEANCSRGHLERAILTAVPLGADTYPHSAPTLGAQSRSPRLRVRESERRREIENSDSHLSSELSRQDSHLVEWVCTRNIIVNLVIYIEFVNLRQSFNFLRLVNCSTTWPNHCRNYTLIPNKTYSLIFYSGFWTFQWVDIYNNIISSKAPLEEKRMLC